MQEDNLEKFLNIENDIEEDLNEEKRLNIFTRIINKEDFAKYPLLSPLLEIHDTPKSLHIKASSEKALEIFLYKTYKNKFYKVLTIVGSRKNSSYGKTVLEYLLKSIAGENIIIVSGLALGIDSLAHRNAIKNNLFTISIPGSGLSEKVLYPSQNISLSQEILATDNILISEYEDDRKSEIYFFPARNRIMSAISDAVLIIEAGEKSGTLITARLAMEYGKNVGVIPNNIFAEGSLGSNDLIKNGAMPIMNKEDLLELLNISLDEQGLLDLDFNNKKDKEKFKNILEELGENERIILEKIIREGNIEKDTLLSDIETEFGISYTDSLVAMMTLEINGFIKEELGEIHLQK